MIAALQNYHWLYYLLILALALSLTLLIIPSIIFVARRHQLYDDLGYTHKQHDRGIPRLGGVAIFVGFTITLLLLGPGDGTFPINYLLTACIMLFAIGIKDDLAGVHHRTKFMIQFLAAVIVVIPGHIRLSNLNGIFGIYALPEFPSVVLSILAIIFIINAFNLIDGIDGLAATTGIIVNGIAFLLFIYMDEQELAIVPLSMVGALLGFIKFNITPAKIFMGDTGSLLIGLVSAVMIIQFATLYPTEKLGLPEMHAALGIAVAILTGPIFDTLRVFILRLWKGDSPFRGDQNHIHHRVLKLGFTHLQTTITLALLNIFLILLAFSLAPFGSMAIIGSITFILTLLNSLLTYLIRCKERNKYPVS